MPLTTAQIIQIAKISQYLSANDIAKGSLFGPRKIPITPQVLYMERKAVEWLYNLDSSDSSLTLTSNYLFSLCRGYNLQAQNILNSSGGGGGGGSVTPVTPSTAPTPYQFLVDGSSFIANGESSKTITAFIGFNLLFSRGGIPQSTINTESSYYSWNRTTGEFTCSPAATTGELFQLFAI